jgi:hypothetical protein
VRQPLSYCSRYVFLNKAGKVEQGAWVLHLLAGSHLSLFSGGLSPGCGFVPCCPKNIFVVIQEM